MRQCDKMSSSSVTPKKSDGGQEQEFSPRAIYTAKILSVGKARPGSRDSDLKRYALIYIAEEERYAILVCGVEGCFQYLESDTTVKIYHAKPPLKRYVEPISQLPNGQLDVGQVSTQDSRTMHAECNATTHYKWYFNNLRYLCAPKVRRSHRFRVRARCNAIILTRFL